MFNMYICDYKVIVKFINFYDIIWNLIFLKFELDFKNCIEIF